MYSAAFFLFWFGNENKVVSLHLILNGLDICLINKNGKVLVFVFLKMSVKGKF